MEKISNRSPASRSSRKSLIGFIVAFVAQGIQTAAFGWNMTPEGPAEMWLDRIFGTFAVFCLLNLLLAEHAKLVARQVHWLDGRDGG